mmetsp:Transcript_10610/g.20579  ORF Transcript_10610/g.20579 Transcript_10610/m.20579 type:complete len:240 (-) Transcript_10610:64-783(-)
MKYNSGGGSVFTCLSPLLQTLHRFRLPLLIHCPGREPGWMVGWSDQSCTERIWSLSRISPRVPSRLLAFLSLYSLTLTRKPAVSISHREKGRSVLVVDKYHYIDLDRQTEGRSSCLSPALDRPAGAVHAQNEREKQEKGPHPASILLTTCTKSLRASGDQERQWTTNADRIPLQRFCVGRRTVRDRRRSRIHTCHRKNRRKIEQKAGEPKKELDVFPGKTRGKIDKNIKRQRYTVASGN